MQKTLPKGWKWVKLGDVCLINPPKPKLTDEDDVTFLPMSSVNEDGVIIERQKRKYGEVQKGYTGFMENDILFAKITPCMENGKGAIARELFNAAGFGSTEFHVIRANQQILPELVFRYLNLNRIREFAEANMTGSAGQKRVPDYFLKTLQVPLPPLPTQHKIVEILEEADNLRKLRQQADEKIKDLIPSLFVQMFGDPATNPKGWKISRLRDHAVAVKNGLFKRPQEFGSGVPLINVVDVFAEYKVDLTKLEKVSATQEETEKYAVQDGDLFFCRSSLKKEGIAKCAVALGLKEPSVFECHTIMVRLNKENLNPLFASIYMNHPGVRAYTVNTSQTATMTTVGQKDILKQQIFLPPLLLQHEFAKLVEDIEAEKARQAEGRKKLDELFNSLMQRAFTGELVA